MDRYSMNRNDMRYRNQRSYSSSNMNSRGCGQEPRPCAPPCSDHNMDIYYHADQLPLAMAYVPMQKYHTLFEPCRALQLGTVFPDLCKPFCGKRGGCK